MTDPKTLEDLIAAIENLFPVGEPTQTAEAVTGEPYITLTSGGVKGEGEIVPVYASTVEKVIELFWQEFLTYALQQPIGAVLYWRRKPEILDMTMFHLDGDKPEGDGIPYYYCRARLLLSSKPPLEKEHDDASEHGQEGQLREQEDPQAEAGSEAEG